MQGYAQATQKQWLLLTVHHVRCSFALHVKQRMEGMSFVLVIGLFQQCLSAILTCLKGCVLTTVTTNSNFIAKTAIVTICI